MMVYPQGQQALDRLLLQLSHRSMMQQYQTQQVRRFKVIVTEKISSHQYLLFRNTATSITNFIQRW